MRDINLIVIHCSATTPDEDIGVTEIRRWHLAQGWSDIGYHYVIRRDGTIENGRPVEIEGAHVKGFNANSIGICLVGGVNTRDKAEKNFTREQFNALAEFLERLRAQYPNTRICGHRDLSPDANGDGVIEAIEWLKDCPCFDAAGWCYTKGIDPQGPTEPKEAAVASIQ